MEGRGFIISGRAILSSLTGILEGTEDFFHLVKV